MIVGTDLGDRRHHACVLDAAGEILAEEAIVNTREVLTAFSVCYTCRADDHGDEHALAG